MEAVSLPETFLTVWSKVFGRTNFSRKETFFVQDVRQGSALPPSGRRLSTVIVFLPPSEAPKNAVRVHRLAQFVRSTTAPKILLKS